MKLPHMLFLIVLGQLGFAYHFRTVGTAVQELKDCKTDHNKYVAGRTQADAAYKAAVQTLGEHLLTLEEPLRTEIATELGVSFPEPDVLLIDAYGTIPAVKLTYVVDDDKGIGQFMAEGEPRTYVVYGTVND